MLHGKASYSSHSAFVQFLLSSLLLFHFRLIKRADVISFAHKSNPNHIIINDCGVIRFHSRDIENLANYQRWTNSLSNMISWLEELWLFAKLLHASNLGSGSHPHTFIAIFWLRYLIIFTPHAFNNGPHVPFQAPALFLIFVPILRFGIEKEERGEYWLFENSSEDFS